MKSTKKIVINNNGNSSNIIKDIYEDKEYEDNGYMILDNFNVRITEKFILTEFELLTNFEEILSSNIFSSEEKHIKLKNIGAFHRIENKLNGNISYSLGLYGRRVYFHLKNQIFHLGKKNPNKNQEIYKMYLNPLKNENDLILLENINIWTNILIGNTTPFDIRGKRFLPLTIYNRNTNSGNVFRNVFKEIINTETLMKNQQSNEEDKIKFVDLQFEEYGLKHFIGDVILCYKLSLNKLNKEKYLQIYEPKTIKFIEFYNGHEEIPEDKLDFRKNM